MKITAHFSRKSFNSTVDAEVVQANKGVRKAALLAYMGHKPDKNGETGNSSSTNEGHYQLQSMREKRIIADEISNLVLEAIPDGWPLWDTHYVKLADLANRLGITRQAALRWVRARGIETVRLPYHRNWTAVLASDLEGHFPEDGGGAAGVRAVPKGDPPQSPSSVVLPIPAEPEHVHVHADGLYRPDCVSVSR